MSKSKPKPVKPPPLPPPEAIPDQAQADVAGDDAKKKIRKQQGFQRQMFTGNLTPNTGKRTTLG